MTSLLEQVANIDNLTNAWKKVYSGKSEDVRKKSKGEDDESIYDFCVNHEINITELSKQLSSNSYIINPLKGFLEKKKNGTYRLISVPTVRDRIIQSSILSVIQSYYPEIKNGVSYCLPRFPLKRKE